MSDLITDTGGPQPLEALELTPLPGAPGDTHVPDPAEEPDGRWLKTEGGELVYTDPPEGGGGGTVQSVNEVAPDEDGDITLAPADIGAAVSGHAHDYASSAQGALADTAVQPNDLADVALTGAYSDLTGAPTIPSTPGEVGADPAGSASVVAAALTVHVADTEAAHDASAISVTPAGGIAATDVQAALTELDTEKAPAHAHPYTDDTTVNAHIADATAAHAASAISVDATGFNGLLTTGDDTAQKVAQKVDDLTTGTTILRGTGVPGAGVGADGNYFIRTDTTPHRLYGPKAAGAWPTAYLALPNPLAGLTQAPIQAQNTYGLVATSGISAGASLGSTEYVPSYSGAQPYLIRDPGNAVTFTGRNTTDGGMIYVPSVAPNSGPFDAVASMNVSILPTETGSYVCCGFANSWGVGLWIRIVPGGATTIFGQGLSTDYGASIGTATAGSTISLEKRGNIFTARLVIGASAGVPAVREFLTGGDFDSNFATYPAFGINRSTVTRVNAAVIAWMG